MPETELPDNYYYDRYRQDKLIHWLAVAVIKLGAVVASGVTLGEMIRLQHPDLWPIFGLIAATSFVALKVNDHVKHKNPFIKAEDHLRQLIKSEHRGLGEKVDKVNIRVSLPDNEKIGIVGTISVHIDSHNSSHDVTSVDSTAIVNLQGQRSTVFHEIHRNSKLISRVFPENLNFE